MKTIDRYLLRELSFPFVIALVGFLIFILLNLILGLKDFMLDRSIGLWTILKILGYQLPFFLVLSLPVATLFAIFLALGRLAHDHEIVALLSSGLSLKRIVFPILIISLLISGFDLFLNDRMVPWANYRYQSLFRQIIFSKRSTPQIQDNTFFKDSEGRFFYVKHYDRKSGRLQGIMIYDLAGAEYLPELGGRYPKVIVAEEGSWDGEVWRLYNGVVHKYDDRGRLQYELKFETLAINVGAGLEQLFLSQRTPQEMSLGELRKKIKALREGGLRAAGLIVEYHSKISIPLAGLVFALFGAPLSLIFSTRSRAVGVVLGVLLVGLFQGSLIWSETLGKRGIIPPALSAWLPDILFGALGLLLFLIMDRVSQLDLRERLRRMLHFVLIIIALSITTVGLAAEPPKVDITADSLTISEDWSTVSAEGNVVVRYGDSSIAAGTLDLSRDEPRWEVSATGEIKLATAEISAAGEELRAELLQDEAGRLSLEEAVLVGFSGENRDGSLRYSGGRARLLFGQELERVELSRGAEIAYRGGSLQAEEITIAKEEGESWTAEAQGGVTLKEEGRETAAEHLKLRFRIEDEEFHAEVAQVNSFRGEGSFTNARGEEHLLRYQGKRATLSFDTENKVKLLDIARGDFTTCGCSEEIASDAYCIAADRVLIFGDDLLVATDITMRVFGVPVFWYPLYLAPLKEERKSPLLPEFGRSGARGWYAKWRLPFILDEQNYGFILLDYFNRY
ncbi:MAG: LptF/LptG family permease, partial [Candidatus Bipolaricaulia bacterium]